MKPLFLRNHRWILLFLVVPVLAFSQTKTESPSKPALTWKDVAGFKSIAGFGGTQLSPDGKWFASVLAPPDGDADIVVQKVGDTTKYTYSIGSLGGGSTPVFPQMSFSDDAKYVAFKVFPKDKEKKAAAKTPGKPLPDKVFLIELATNKKTEFERVKSFAFNGEKSSHLALLLVSNSGAGTPPSGGSGASDTPKGADMLLYELASGKTQNIGNVADMAFNKAGTWLALTIDAAEKAGNGVHVRNMSTGVTMILDNDKARYQSLGWTEKGDAVALLKGTKDEKFKNDRFAVLGIKGFDGVPSVTTYDPKADSTSFPKDMTVSPNRTPFWTEDLTRLMFGIHKLELAKKDEKKEDKKDSSAKKPSDTELLAKLKADSTIKTIDDLTKAITKAKGSDSTKSASKDGAKDALKDDDKPEKPDMAIWHWQDRALQSRQQVSEPQDKNFSFLAMYDIAAKKYIRLADSALRSITPAPKYLYGIGQNTLPYDLQASKDGQSFTDVVVVDLKTGNRSAALEKHYVPNGFANPQPSPDGTKFFYWADGHWYVYDIASKTKRNLTEGAPTSFVDVEDDHNVRKPPYDFYGWTSDSKAGLASDGWDVWMISVDGKKAQNLTQNGKRDKIRYENRYRLDPDEKGIDMKQPQYFHIYGEWTKKSGFARLDGGQTKQVLWEDAALGELSKAKKANVYAFSRQSFTTPRNFHVSASPELTGAKQSSANAPDFSKYAWSPGTRLVNYVSDKGDTLQGALFLPAGYEEGKKYPTVVYYYEKLSQTLHNFSTPGYSGTGWNPGVYTSNGYAVFIPDIVYKLNDPGMSAIWCVLPAVKAAIKTGVIDEERIGIHGHSWGGYQTCFLSTQTSMFKAAAAGAPLTDMISMYNLIYKNNGISNGQIFEASQGRLVAPWDNWEAYYRNSPLHHVTKVTTPMLLLHNDADGAVDFTQGVEFYVALRRLGKPVVMVQYKGENHGLAKLPNRKDYSVRMMEFFDVHLKGKPAPEWLQKGVERLQMEDHLDKRALMED